MILKDIYILYSMLQDNEVSFNPNMSLNGLHADPRYQPDDKNIAYSPYTFVSGGTQPEHFYQRSYTTEIKFDITSQVTNQHEVKFGFKSKWDKLDFVFFDVLRNRSNYLTPIIPDPVNQQGINRYLFAFTKSVFGLLAG